MSPPAPVSAPSPPSGPRDPVRVPLSRRGRTVALCAHVVAAGAWLGVDVALVVLVATAQLTDDPSVAGLCLRVLPLLLAPLVVAGLLTLATGLLLGLGTRWGVLRHWWVMAKLGITLLYLVLIPTGLSPTVADRAAHGQALLDRATVTVDVGRLVFPAAFGPLLLVTATVLSIAKPRGRRGR